MIGSKYSKKLLAFRYLPELTTFGHLLLKANEAFILTRFPEGFALLLFTNVESTHTLHMKLDIP